MSFIKLKQYELQKLEKEENLMIFQILNWDRADSKSRTQLDLKGPCPVCIC